MILSVIITEEILIFIIMHYEIFNIFIVFSTIIDKVNLEKGKNVRLSEKISSLFPNYYTEIFSKKFPQYFVKM